MALDVIQALDVIEAMENFIERKRPPEHIRPQLDIGYKMEGRSIIVFEIRPQWNKPEVIREHAVAKTTFIISKKHWRIFSLRSDLKWHSYAPRPTVLTISEFTQIIEEDKQHWFWG